MYARPARTSSLTPTHRVVVGAAGRHRHLIGSEFDARHRSNVRAMPLCSYHVVARSAAPPERVFELLADATSWPLWAGPLIAHGSWDRQGDSAPGGVGAIRKIGRWPMFGREQVVVSESPSHHAYTTLSGNPVRNYRADVRLTPDGDGTLIAWSGEFDPLVPGTGRLLEGTYRRLIGSFARRLATYAEEHLH
jgi:hypothetical protein